MMIEAKAKIKTIHTVPETQLELDVLRWTFIPLSDHDIGRRLEVLLKIF